MASVHIIDDDSGIREMLMEYLQLEGYDVSSFSSGEEALPAVLKDPPDVILLDIQLPGMDGLAFLELLREDFADVEVIMITGYGDVGSAVRAMKLGAWDYIRKPFGPEEISVVVKKAVEAKKKDEQLAYLQRDQKIHAVGDIIGASEPWQDVFRSVRKIAESARTSVLICGDTGTGKELFAKFIHYNGPRANKPFVEINCSAFQETLLESELFGYEAGAFTGARQRKKGLLEIADEGTFFLDEIGDMSLELQARILKVIEEQTFRRVGGTKEIRIDIRVISASSRNLVKAVSDGTFRNDLFYRLNVASVVLPPLRDRGEDVILLAEHFLNMYNLEFSRNISGLDPEVRPLLLEHSWPGNVRELKNVIERAVLFEKGEYLSSDSVRLLDVSQPMTSGSSALSPSFSDFELPSDGVSLHEMEKSFIKKALEKTEGNKARAARLLGMSREKLRYRIKKLGV